LADAEKLATVRTEKLNRHEGNRERPNDRYAFILGYLGCGEREWEEE
jgi:hypothetical protein